MIRQKAPLWKQILLQSLTTTEALSAFFEIDETALQKVTDRYPMRINPYYLGLIKKKDDPIYKQCIPDNREISDKNGMDDPLNEEGLSPVFGLTHKYPDRVLFLVSAQCAMYCRFCNRKRKVGRSSMVTKKSIKEGFSYIKGHKKIRDVLLSGGDPLLLENRDLYSILTELRAINHVEIIRIGTRVPCTLPQRITHHLAKMLKKFHPLYIHTHFNHPDEITPEATLACERLADAGIPMGCQIVLLKGVNDDLTTMKNLVQKLLIIRVRPYYLFQADLTKGTSHFWTPINKGLEIISGLQGYTSGLCVPHFAVDLPRGGGKVPLLPKYVMCENKNSLVIKNYLGQEYQYPLYDV
jgi:lysine 2,3-aminomutase